MTSAPTNHQQGSSLWRNRDFNLLWSSQTLSDLGAHTSLLAVPLLVLAVTGSPTKAGMVGTVEAVVRAVVRLPAGAVADRWNRRTIMLTSDGVRLCLFATLVFLVWTDQAGFVTIVVLVGTAGVFEAAFAPAETAAIAKLVPDAQLADAFARNEARSYGTSLAGPPLGGVLYGVGRAVPFIFDAATYAVSFVAVWRIRQPMQGTREGTGQSLIGDIVTGVRHVFTDSFLRSLLLVAVPLNFAATGALFTITLTLRQAGHAASAIGIVQGIIGVGGFLGALAASALQRRLSLRALVLVVAWTLTGCIAVAAVLTTDLVVATPLAVGLFLAPAANAALFGHLAHTTPNELQGRVVSVVGLTATTVAAMAPLAGGLLLEHIGGAAAMALFAASVTIAALAATLSPGIHTEPTPQHDP